MLCCVYYCSDLSVHRPLTKMSQKLLHGYRPMLLEATYLPYLLSVLSVFKIFNF